jgi:hypothetical protein
MMMADARNKSIAATARLMWADGGMRGLFKVLQATQCPWTIAYVLDHRPAEARCGTRTTDLPCRAI